MKSFKMQKSIIESQIAKRASVLRGVNFWDIEINYFIK